MTASTAAKPTANPRQPLSLRELFCLTTLAAITVALALEREWVVGERWLLQLALPGTLLGILAARMSGRQAWLLGMLGGTLGTAVALGIWGYFAIARWNEYATRSSVAQQEQLRTMYQIYALGMIVIGALLAFLMIAAYRVLMWASAPGEQNLFSSGKRHPYWAALVFLCIALICAGIMNIDFLATPRAWTPNQFIAFPRDVCPADGDCPVATVTLSRDGKWLAFRVLDSRLNEGKPQILLYRLDPKPEHFQLPSIGEESSVRSLLQFSCDDDRCAYLVHAVTGDGNVRASGDVHVLDLATEKAEVLGYSASSLIWLPGRRLLMDDKNLLTEQAGDWSWQEIEAADDYQPRLGYAAYRDRDCIRLSDLQTFEEIRKWPKEMHGAFSTFTPNGRYVLCADWIYDYHSQIYRTWDKGPQGTRLSYSLVTRSGHGVGILDDWAGPRFDSLFWLARIPFGYRLESWLTRPTICVVDPATGKEVARTRSLLSQPDDIAFSFDGSRMAVINLEGVYIYDVPAEFR
jgi:hypothetical protein